MKRFFSGRVCFCYAFLVFFAGTSFAQKVELLDRSDYKHNYVVARFEYIEDLADTSMLKYIATLQIHVDNFPFTATHFYTRFKSESEIHGANAYRIVHYAEQDSSVTITIRTYFAPEKFFTINEAKRDTGKLYVFSAERKKNFNQTFYKNDSLIKFNSMGYYEIDPGPGEFIRIGANKHNKATKPIRKKYLPGMHSHFVAIGEHLPDNMGIIIGVTIGITGALIYEAVTSPKKHVYLNYNAARMLLEIYKPANNILR